jgi:glycosyltransferase involved in cell wall biosynthesis
MKISIIIPCFNERNSLEDLISQITFLQKNYEVEFILIENGSIDDSKEFFIEIEGKHKNIQIVFCS